MTLQQKRVEKLEVELTSPAQTEWVRIILHDTSEEEGVVKWMCNKNTNMRPENTICRVIVCT